MGPVIEGARLGGQRCPKGVTIRRRAAGFHQGLVPRTVNGTGHTGPSEFCATSIKLFSAARQNAVLRRSPFPSP